MFAMAGITGEERWHLLAFASAIICLHVACMTGVLQALNACMCRQSLASAVVARFGCFGYFGRNGMENDD